MMRTSKFKRMLKINEADFQESIYLTLRLAYVGLFHKMESFMNDMLRMAEIFSGDEIYTEPIDKYARQKIWIPVQRLATVLCNSKNQPDMQQRKAL